MQKQGKNHWSRETTVQGPHSPSRDTHIFELFWRHWSDSVLSASTQNPGWLELEGWWCWLSLTSTPPIRRLPTSWSCALWTIAINLLATLGISLPWSPLLGKAIKPFFSQFSSVQSLSRVQLFATPWIAARQASLSITNSWSVSYLSSLEWRCLSYVLYFGSTY